MFTREDTKKIKGVAILLMLIHHLWFFPDRLPMDMQLQPLGIIIACFDLKDILGGFGKICVGIYAFLGGYGLWKKLKRQETYSLASDIVSLYKELWKVAIFFIPIGLCFFREQPDYTADPTICHVFNGSRAIKLAQTFSGLFPPYNYEWWFFTSYLGALILGYVFIKINKNQNFWLDVLLVVLIQIFSQGIIPAIGSTEIFRSALSGIFQSLFIRYDICVCSFFMGIVFAKYNALERLLERFHRMFQIKAERLVVSAVGLFIIIICRQFCYEREGELAYVPLLIVFALEWINTFQVFQRIFLTLGKYSTGIWLTHTFYCYYFYTTARVVCFSQNAWIALFVLLMMSLLTAIAIKYFWKLASKSAKRLWLQ